MINFHTFSITARDRETGAFGVAVATARPNVGSLVPWVSPRGAIATQARVNTDLGRQGLGQAASGDKRGKQSAALLVAAIREPRRYHNLRVDDHADPVAELRRVWGVVVAHTKQIEAEYGPAALRLFGRVK